MPDEDMLIARAASAIRRGDVAAMAGCLTRYAQTRAGLRDLAEAAATIVRLVECEERSTDRDVMDVVSRLCDMVLEGADGMAET